ncbi:hypothetical protein [Candidatus Spongiihabitans sp.]|uniref:hypothetical protein n=1 Tax=Candidatus Spongiihabitans sp. TaxID=3101308 RepID=UPI003C7A61A8
MTVLLRKKVNIRGNNEEIKVFRPSGVLSREDQGRAEELDVFLANKVPVLAKRIMQLPDKTTPMRRWYQLGQELRKIVDGNDLVSRSDVQNGLIWEGIKQYLPETIGLKGAGQAHDSNSPQHGDRGHLPICYATSRYAWVEIKWLRRWDDWCNIYYRGSMWKDKRVIESLREEITKMQEYPKRKEFREIIKNLAAQTTGKHIEVLNDSVIVDKVHSAVEQALLSAA